MIDSCYNYVYYYYYYYYYFLFVFVFVVFLDNSRVLWKDTHFPNISENDTFSWSFNKCNRQVYTLSRGYFPNRIFHLKKRKKKRKKRKKKKKKKISFIFPHKPRNAGWGVGWGGWGWWCGVGVGRECCFVLFISFWLENVEPKESILYISSGIK